MIITRFPVFQSSLIYSQAGEQCCRELNGRRKSPPGLFSLSREPGGKINSTVKEGLNPIHTWMYVRNSSASDRRTLQATENVAALPEPGHGQPGFPLQGPFQASFDLHNAGQWSWHKTGKTRHQHQDCLFSERPTLLPANLSTGVYLPDKRTDPLPLAPHQHVPAGAAAKQDVGDQEHRGAQRVPFQPEPQLLPISALRPQLQPDRPSPHTLA